MEVILHIPHAGRDIPKEFEDDYVGGRPTADRETMILGDLYTDDLFVATDAPVLPLVFPYSRVFVDVERFRDDAAEAMANRGMGALYSRGHDGSPIRQQYDSERRESILTRYYDPHHAELNKLAEDQLRKNGRALILDCHSFPQESLPYEAPQSHERPEICIGTDPFHTPDSLCDALVGYFLELGYTVALNQPFSGSIVPLPYYQQDRNIMSIMLEVRRDLFLESATGEPSAGFDLVKKHVGGAIEAMLSGAG